MHLTSAHQFPLFLPDLPVSEQRKDLYARIRDRPDEVRDLLKAVHTVRARLQHNPFAVRGVQTQPAKAPALCGTPKGLRQVHYSHISGQSLPVIRACRVCA
jgi:hypothetical protein